ncbi:SDR family oxidoreductase [Streptomyces sp. NPDC059506]|uniref:SDR family oxidoreductase n=1 Tax=Streptomyces TaxID=1883 RepID=UPI0015F7A960|nr:MULTISPECIES: SDR family oxidoreductase [unclassified Streptomyces]MCZ2527645.1 SDR family oxidoreductase [Streptomyces sp. HB2AG]QMV21649.1 SDR family oxidoreductase [Streptomyces sp. SCUT-3]
MSTHVITGASSGIGEAVAGRLAARGDRLVLLARNERRAAELAERFPGSTALVADLEHPEGMAGALGGALPERIDSLVHSAGVADLGGVGEADAAVWARTLAVNLAAPAELTRLCLPALRAARGQVVFVNSGSGLHTGPRWGAYSASKHGLRALAEALRAEEQGNGVRVTSVYPGRVATRMQENIHAQEGRAYDPGAWIAPESVATVVLTALDLPRDAVVTDLSVRPNG